MDETLKKLQDIANSDSDKWTKNEGKKWAQFLLNCKPDQYNRELCETYIRAVGAYCRYADGLDDGLNQTAMAGIFREVSSDVTTMLYELIQNADDSFLNTPNKNIGDGPKLNIDFAYSDNDPEELATITLEYNENGFRPEDVFSICTIGHSTKTRDPSKRPIGHKGVGFKSMFKIVDSVWIQSGFYSFELSLNEARSIDGEDVIIKKSYFIPKIRAVTDSFDGTKITISLKSGPCKDLYDNCVKRFFRNDAVFESNPLLFLRNISSISLRCGNDNTVFTKIISNLPEGLSRGLKVKKGNLLSIQVNSNEPKNYSFDLYSREVYYDIKLYRERYPYRKDYKEFEDFPYETYSAAVLSCETNDDFCNGGLYAGLPTKVRTTVPIAFDIPFLLDLSRSYPEDTCIKWTAHTHDELKNFVETLYLSLAEDKKGKIVYYLPKTTESVFRYDKESSESGNLKALMVDSDKQIRYTGSWICDLPIFDVNGSMKSAKDICCFRAEDHIEEQENVAEWLKKRKETFYTPDYTDMSSFGCTNFIEDVKNELLKVGLNHIDNFPDILNWHENHINDLIKLGTQVDRNEYYSVECLKNPDAYHKLVETSIFELLKHPSLGEVKVWQQLVLAYSLRHNYRFKDVLNWVKGIDKDTITSMFKEDSDLPNIKLEHEQIIELLEHPKLIECVELQKLLFRTVQYSLEDFEYILNKLNSIQDIHYDTLFPKSGIILDKDLVKILLEHNELSESLSELNKKAIDFLSHQYFRLNVNEFDIIDPKISEEIEKVDRNCLDDGLLNYLQDKNTKKLARKMFVFETDKPICLLCSNGMLLAKGHEFASLANLVSDLKLENDRSFFSFRLKLKEIYVSLDKYDPDVPCDSTYLMDLAHKKEYEYEAAASLFGSQGNNSKNGINSRIIPRVSNTKFISELLQNAQDTEYDLPEPEFQLQFSDDSSSIEIITNE